MYKFLDKMIFTLRNGLHNILHYSSTNTQHRIKSYLIQK